MAHNGMIQRISIRSENFRRSVIGGKKMTGSESRPDVTDQHLPEQTPRHLVNKAKRQSDRAKQRFSGTSAGRYWSRLSATDFMTKAMTLAAILLLCAFPFFIVAAALTNQSVVYGLVRRLGLDHQAAQDVGRLFEPAHSTTASLSGAAYVLFILGGIAAVAAVQDLYEKAFDLEPKGLKNLPRQLASLILIGGTMVLVTRVTAPPVYHLGGVALAAIVGMVLYSMFWILFLWLLLAGRVSWSIILPSAIATGVCWTGMYVIFHFVFSGSITSDYNKYGPIGVVFALMSYFIAVGVVISIGAVFGIFWNERKLPDTTGATETSSLGRS
jgi:membrane protein